MIIERLNILTGNRNRMDLDITEEQLARFQRGELVQNVFPHLNATEREFLLSGMSAQEQKELYGW